MNQSDKKRIAKRLRKSNKDVWGSLSQDQKDFAISQYDKETNPTLLSPRNLINEVWSRADSVDLLAMGVLLGIIGGMVGSIFNEEFEKFGIIYKVSASLALFLILFGFAWLREEVFNRGLREGKLLERLINNKNSQ